MVGHTDQPMLNSLYDLKKKYQLMNRGTARNLVGVKAITDVQPGDEFFVNYGKQYRDSIESYVNGGWQMGMNTRPGRGGKRIKNKDSDD